MATSTQTALAVTRREPSGSRSARRLRREGNVPGVIYGGGEEPVAFAVDARELRHALADAGAVLDLTIDGGKSSPVVVKELVRHPVSGETMHLDLLRVRMDVAIQATVVLELVGAEDAPGVREGGVLEHVTRELTIEALPGDIPDSLQHDVSGMQIGDTLSLSDLTPPGSVTLVDDAATTIATVTPPRLQVEAEDEIEEETGLVAEGAPEAAGDDAAAETESAGEGDSGE